MIVCKAAAIKTDVKRVAVDFTEAQSGTQVDIITRKVN